MLSRSNGPSAYVWHACDGIPPTSAGRRSHDAYADHKRFLREFMGSDERCRETECAVITDADRLAVKLRQASRFLGIGDRVRVAQRGKSVYVERVA